MKSSTRTKVLGGVFAGVAVTLLTGALMGQGPNQPVKSEPQFFVTGDDGEGAHLWVREGNALRVVGHGECKECKGHDDHDHKDGHDHDAPAKKK
ncbi:MAG: hypothetical protein J0L78_08410 [Planctomycetes bacterium]|nr:hypothetical protein [Planctomycetota bacterium]